MRLVHRPGCAWKHDNDVIFAHLCGIVEEAQTASPSPMVHVLTKHENFTIKEGSFLFPLSSGGLFTVGSVDMCWKRQI